MLVLSRSIGEELLIGTTVRVRVVGVKGRRVLLAIDAPQDVRIDRREIRDRVVREGAKHLPILAGAEPREESGM